MPTKNVNLSVQQTRFIRRAVGQGGYRNASEVVRAGLRLLENQEQEEQLKIGVLRRLADEAFGEIDRGEFDLIAAGGLDEFMAKVDARVRATMLK